MRTATAEVPTTIALVTVIHGLCDEAQTLLAAAPIRGRDAVELSAVCQRLAGVARLLHRRELAQRLNAVSEEFDALTTRQRLRRMIKRARKSAKAKRDCTAAKHAARFIDQLPDHAIEAAAAADLANDLCSWRLELSNHAVTADIDAVWLKCRRDYGRVRGFGSAWRDGEARICYADWERSLVRVYTQLGVLAPQRSLDRDAWEALIRLVGDRAALEALRRHLLRAAGRISPAFVVPRTVDLIDDLAATYDSRIAHAHAECFEARPRSYFAHMRHRTRQHSLLLPLPPQRPALDIIAEASRRSSSTRRPR